VHPAPLVCGALEAAAQRGDQAGVLVGDHQAHPGQAPAAQVGQERPPERLFLAVPDGEAEDFPAAGGGDAGGHHHGFGHHLPEVDLAHVQVGGVEVDVGEAGARCV